MYLFSVSISLSRFYKFPYSVSGSNYHVVLTLIGHLSGQAAWSRGLSRVLSFYVGEKHPQCFPYCCYGLLEQIAAGQQIQPGASPLEKTATSAQQDRAAYFHIQQGQVQELLCHVSAESARAITLSIRLW